MIGADDVEASGDGFAGTTGKGEHLDTLTVSLGRGNSGDVTVSLLNNGNWSDWAGDGTSVGVSDTPFEGLKVRLSEELSHNHSIWYRVHSSEFGWLGWAHDGEEAGSTGYARCVEAVEIRFVAKGDAVPGSEANAFLDAANELPKINYVAHVATIGWQTGVSFDESKLDSVPMARTTGRSLSMEALNASISWLGHGGGVETRSHAQDYGWQPRAAGTTGATGCSKRIEAIECALRARLLRSMMCTTVSILLAMVGLARRPMVFRLVLVERAGASKLSKSCLYPKKAGVLQTHLLLHTSAMRRACLQAEFISTILPPWFLRMA